MPDSAWALIFAALLFIGGVVLLIAGVGLLGVCAWWFASAVRAAHTARAHGAQADATTSIIEQTTSALDDLPETPLMRPPTEPPSAKELRELILASRQARNGHSEDYEIYTTDGNEGIPDDQPPIPPGGFYRDVTE